jgi:replicative DNA helicase
MDSFDFQSADTYLKKYENKDMFDNEDDHLTKGKAKDEKKELAKHLKADKMMQVGSTILPIEQYAELILAKQRQGTPNKIIPFIFKGPYSSFTSMHLVSSYTE